MQHGAWPGEAGDFSSSTLAPGEADDFSIYIPAAAAFSPMALRSARCVAWWAPLNAPRPAVQCVKRTISVLPRWRRAGDFSISPLPRSPLLPGPRALRSAGTWHGELPERTLAGFQKCSTVRGPVKRAISVLLRWRRAKRTSSAYPRCRRVQPDGSAFSTVGGIVSSPERHLGQPSSAWSGRFQFFHAGAGLPPRSPLLPGPRALRSAGTWHGELPERTLAGFQKCSTVRDPVKRAISDLLRWRRAKRTSSAYPRCRRVQPDGSAFSTVRGIVSSPERTSASRPVREADDFSSSTLAPGGRFQHIPAAAGPAGSAFSRYV